MASGAPINKIERAHQMYREGSYEEALVFYTEALSLAKPKSQKIALHSNRAACYLKLNHFNKAAEECTSVLDLDHKHTGALMLRAQTLVTLKEYQSSLFDVNRLIDLNPSSEVYQNLQARLKTQLSLAPIPEAETELEDDEDIYEAEQKEEEEDEQVEVELETHADKEGGQVEEGELEQDTVVVKNQNTKNGGGAPTNEVITLQTFDHSQKAEKVTEQSQSLKESAEQNSSGWQTIPKPKGHSHLDYSRWDRVEDDSSDDDDDEEDEESKPQFRFRVRTVGVRPVK